MPDINKVSVIVVTWNSADEIERCINSLLKNHVSGNSGIEIIAVDNNSSDDSVEILKRLKKENEASDVSIKLILNKENSGFTNACNQGIEISTGDNIFFLNPDTEIVDGAVEKLRVKLNSSESTGAVAPKLLNEDGTVQKSCRTFPEYSDMLFEMTLMSGLFPESKTFSRWKMNYFDHESEISADQPMAAALMVKRKVLESINHFDERFRMFFNDVDLCKKIRDSGYNIIFFPESEIMHLKGVSIYKDREKMIKIWNKDCAEYFKKHHYKNNSGNNFIKYNLLKAGLAITGSVRILLYKLTK